MALKDSIINLVLKGKDLVSPATKTAADSVGKLQERSDELTAALEKLTKTERNIEQFKKLSKESDRLKDNWQDAEFELKQLKQAFEATEKPTKAMARELEKAEKSAEGAQVAWRRNRDSLDRLTPQLKAAGVNMDNLDQSQDDVQQSAMRLRSDLTGVNVQLDRQEKAAKEAAEGTEDLGNEAERSSGLISKLGAGLKTMAAGATALVAGIGASAATLTVFSRSQASLADEITNTSNAIGVNREALQVWQVAGERVGLTGEKVTDILRSVTERLGEFAANGGGEAAQVMERLNLQIEDFEGLAPDQQMLRFAQAIESLPKSEQVALLEKLASDASQLQPLLDNNAAGLKAIAEEASQSGAIYSEEELNKLTRANDIYNSITIKIQGLTRRIGAELAPAVADATDKVVKLFDQNNAGEKLIELFRRITKWGADMAASLVGNQDSIVSGFQKVVDTVQFLGNGIAAVFRTVQTAGGAAVTFVASALANFLTIAAKVTEGLNKIGVVSDEAYTTLQAKADAANATVNALTEQTAEYGRKALQAGKDAANAFNNTEEAARKTADQIERTAGTLEPMPDAIQEVDEKLSQTGETGKEAGEKIKASFEEMLEAATDEEGLKQLEADLLKTASAGTDVSGQLRQVRERLEEIREVQGGGLGVGKDIKDAGSEADKATPKFRNMADIIGDTSKEAGEFRKKWQDAFGGAFGKAISNARESVTSLSVAARNLFETKIGGNIFVSEGESAAESLEKARQRTDELASARRRLMSSSLAAWFADTALAAAQVKERFYEQAVAMENLQEKIDSGSFSLDQLNQLSKTAANRFDLLDKQRLNGLQSAIDAARSRLESLNASAESTLNSLRQRLADISGDTEEAQRLQYEAERKRLQEQLEQARDAGADSAAADYARALEQLEKINRIEQQNRREAENERERQAAERQRQQEQAERERQQFERQRNTTTNQQQSVQSRASQTIILQTPSGERTEVQTDDPDSLLRTLEEVGLRSTP